MVGLAEVDASQVALVGGKGASLGGLSRIAGVVVPPGFCVTTEAFRRFLAEAPSVDDLLDRSARLQPDDRAGISALGAQIRRALERTPVPADIGSAVREAVAGLGADVAWAVRSSATAEDLPTASSAGQHDSHLDVRGPDEVLRHVVRCWASTFTDRAVAYRLRHGIGHRSVQMAVVVQRMVPAEVSGVLFTADPVTGNRTVSCVEAVAGLGDALVAGLVSPDTYRVRDGEVVTGADTADRPVLTHDQVLRLVELGRRLEACLGSPQDVEWCLVDDGYQVVQSRPITTLFPVPEADDGENHVYVSVGHQQMMTDPMKPLGLSFWQLTTPAPMAEAGGRLFVDVTRRLAAPSTRAGILEALGRSDPLTGDALRTVLERDGFVRPLPEEQAPGPLLGAPPDPVETDPAIVTELVAASEASVAAAERAIAPLAGEPLLDFIESDLQELRRILFDRRSHQVFMSAMDGTVWLNDRLQEWLGERNAADVLTRSVPRNVTSEMGLALLDVADVVRRHPAVRAFLEQADEDDLLEGLDDLPGGPETRTAIEGWLARYGMRCVGEIDITRPRWSERPGTLVPVILAHVANVEPGAAARRFEQGRQEAEAKAQDLLRRLRALPDGEAKAVETERVIDRVRTFIGYREYPKYGMVSRYFVYKRALLREADRLVAAGVLGEAEDLFFLRFDELRDVVRSQQVDDALLRRRKEAFASYGALAPPRVLTSQGEALTGAYRRDDVPAGALAGLPVSAGVVEGRARVPLDLSQGDLEPGDILVTRYTDPSWTPLFVTIAGLVTEVGGLMTHGAVIAREYGLPAVVGVVDATRLIRDGQRIRLHGTDGHVELLTGPAAVSPPDA